MKRIIMLIALMTSLTSCGCLRKAIKTHLTTTDSLHAMKTADYVSGSFIDTTKTDASKITIVEIVFFEPPKDTGGKATIVIDDDGIRVNNAENVKEVKKTTVESSSIHKGESQIESSLSTAMDSTNVSQDKYIKDEMPVQPPKGQNIKLVLGIVLAIIIAAIVLIAIIKF